LSIANQGSTRHVDGRPVHPDQELQTPVGRHAIRGIDTASHEINPGEPDTKQVPQHLIKPRVDRVTVGEPDERRLNRSDFVTFTNAPSQSRAYARI
jgi:hypothetical protein